MIACKEIGEGERAAPELLGDVQIKPIRSSDAYVKKLESTRVKNADIISLLERYAARKQFGDDTKVEEKTVEYQI